MMSLLTREIRLKCPKIYLGCYGKKQLLLQNIIIAKERIVIKQFGENRSSWPLLTNMDKDRSNSMFDDKKQ